MKRLPASDELRTAAAVALGQASESARAPAISLLAQLVTPERGAPIPTNIGATTLSREETVLLACARSLLAVGGKGYRGLVAERAERSAAPLRSQLKRLLS